MVKGKQENDPRLDPLDIAMPASFELKDSEGGQQMVTYLGVQMTLATMNALIEQQTKS